MVIFDKTNYVCQIYEIKHSDKPIKEQARHLIDDKKIELIENKYGKVIKKCVLYREKNTMIDNIEYINVEKYLMEL